MSRILARRAAPLAACALLALSPLTARAATPYVTIHTFGAYQDGENPAIDATLLLASDHNFYGTTVNGGPNNYGTVFQLTPAGVLKTLHSFTNIGTPLDGYHPEGKLLEGKDGYLYGTCVNGGASSGGTIYRIKKDGTAFSVVYEFTSAAYHPYDGLVQDSSSVLYGAAVSGTSNDGTIYKIKTDGTGFTVVHAFLSNGTEGSNLYFSPVLNGTTLYGTAQNGGTSGHGTIYRVKTDGTGFTVLHLFTATTDGYSPRRVLVGTDGKLYGDTYYGGSHSNGTVFSLKTDGSSYADIHDFTATTDGYYPQAGLVQGSDGLLYGVTKGGGTVGTASAHGTVFKIKTDGTAFAVMHAFAADNSEGTNETDLTGLAIGADGLLYGARENGGGPRNIGFAYSVSTTGTGFKTVFDFSNGFVDGQHPYYGSLVIGPGNDFYGTTYTGGTGGYGTVYRMTTAGSLTNLHAFTDNASLEDGARPYAGLLTGPNSTLLGTTFYGGTYDAGSVFSVGGDGTGFATTLSFGTAAGANLPSGLVKDSHGTLYGTSYYGGRYNKGSVFRVGTDGFESVIYSFHDTTDGRFPNGSLRVGTDGALYGTTLNGGAGGYGTVYKVTTAGAYTLLHAFKSDGTEGAYPYSGVVQDKAGKLYGTTYQSGQFNYGTIYTVGATGSGYKTLHSFTAQSDGGNPFAGLLLATDGRLYGTTSRDGSVNGGSNNAGGTLFRINTSGSSFTVAHTFSPTTEGYNPYSAPTEGRDGNLYGTTYNGGVAPYPGTNIYGSAYKLSVLLPLVTSFSPTGAAKGATVTLTGVNFTGATAVTFGTGLTNALTVNSDTKITVKVPTNATTGPIIVTTNKGTGASTATFTVQ